MQSSFTTKGDLSAFDTENTRVAAGGAERGANRAAGKKAQFHQPVSEIMRQVQTDQGGGLTRPQFSQTS